MRKTEEFQHRRKYSELKEKPYRRMISFDVGHKTTDTMPASYSQRTPVKSAPFETDRMLVLFVSCQHCIDTTVQHKSV
jgi:hypothetical protein